MARHQHTSQVFLIHLGSLRQLPAIHPRQAKPGEEQVAAGVCVDSAHGRPCNAGCYDVISAALKNSSGCLPNRLIVLHVKDLRNGIAGHNRSRLLMASFGLATSAYMVIR